MITRCFILACLSFTYILKAEAQVSYEPNAAIGAQRARAALIYRRLTGQKIPIDSQIIKDMEVLLNQNRPIDAAKLATDQTGYYNYTLRFFGQKLSTINSTTKAPFSDFTATIMGFARDDKDIRDLLITDKYYLSNATALAGQTISPVATPANRLANVVRSNNHYTSLENALVFQPNINLAATLVEATQEVTVDGAGALVRNPDAAGILTSRTFMQDCALGGTNRRCYEQVMVRLACTKLEDISDVAAPDDRVRIDVTRSPGGDPAAYQNTCRGCHGNMDSMNGAFAYAEFVNGEILLSNVRTANTNLCGANANAACFDVNRVANKYNQGVASGFSQGYRTTDNSWRNRAVTGAIGEYFGWRGTDSRSIATAVEASGINSFGRMIANSQAFSRCMVKKVYSTVCRREASANEAKFISTVAGELENPAQGNRRLNWLFQRVATDEMCIGR